MPYAAILLKDKAMSYIYIIHSKHFDIDGPDTLYKFGATEQIKRRKFDTCYRTAFKYPCAYKAYWNLGKTVNCFEVEKAIKDTLLAPYLGSRCGMEMYDISLNELVSLIEGKLRELNIVSTGIFRDDIYHRSKDHNDIAALTEQKKRDRVASVNVECLTERIKNIYNCDYTEYDIADEDAHHCYACNKILRCKRIVFHTRFGSRSFGTTCARKHVNISRIIEKHSEIEQLQGVLKDDEIVTKLLTRGVSSLHKYLHNPYWEYTKKLKAEEPFQREELLAADNNILARDIFCGMSHLRAEAFVLSLFCKSNLECCDMNLLRRQVSNIKELKQRICLDSFIYAVENKLIDTFTIIDTKVHLASIAEAARTIDRWLSKDRDVIACNDPRLQSVVKKLISYKSVSADNDDPDHVEMKPLLLDKNFIDIIRRSVSVLTGGPGTGKTTTFASVIAPILQALGYELIICSPTAIAADKLKTRCNDAAKTYREKCEEVAYRDIPNSYTMHQLIYSFKYDREGYRPRRAYIIDESSMLSTTLFARFIKHIDTDDKVMFIGDVDQLPPVFGPCVLSHLKNHSYRFELTKLRRYGTQLRRIFDGVRGGNFSPLSVDFDTPNPIGGRPQSYSYYKSRMDVDSILDIISKERPLSVDLFSGGVGATDSSSTVILAPTNALVNSINKSVRARLGFRDQWCVGDLIIFTKNNYPVKYFNGQRGRITAINYKAIGFTDEDTESEHPQPHAITSADPIDALIWDVLGGGVAQPPASDKPSDKPAQKQHESIQGKVIVSMTIDVVNGDTIQLDDPSYLCDIKHRYCMTVHKAQGNEFATVWFITGNSISNDWRLFYTAVTRVQQHLRIISERDITTMCRERGSEANRVYNVWEEKVIKILNAALTKCKCTLYEIELYTNIKRLVSDGIGISQKQADNLKQHLNRPNRYVDYDKNNMDKVIDKLVDGAFLRAKNSVSPINISSVMRPMHTRSYEW
jgi:hypothetical protein